MISAAAMSASLAPEPRLDFDDETAGTREEWIAALSAAWRGYRDGLRGPAGRRKPLRARTLWRMTRLGRPPVI